MMPAINSGQLNVTPNLAVTLTSRLWPPPSHNSSQVLIPKCVDMDLTASSIYIIVYLIREHFNRYTHTHTQTHTHTHTSMPLVLLCWSILSVIFPSLTYLSLLLVLFSLSLSAYLPLHQLTAIAIYPLPPLSQRGGGTAKYCTTNGRYRFLLLFGKDLTALILVPDINTTKKHEDICTDHECV